jgi:GNAT superfamily N-acetyltransferase
LIEQMIIRAMEPSRDLDGFLRVLHQVDPFPRTPDEWWERARSAEPSAFRRYLVGEVDGEIVAIGALLDSDLIANAVTARLVVDEAHRGRGRGRALAEALDALLGKRDPAPILVNVRVRDDDSDGRAWAERRGFRFHSHAIRSRLDLATFDPAAHLAVVDRARAAGYAFEPPDDGDRLYALYAELIRDVPDQFDPMSRDAFRRQVDLRRDMARLVAKHPSGWAGLALLSPAGADGAFNDFTGVRPEHRGHGVATALKVLIAVEATRAGRSWIETVNHAHNGPMLAVNRALGYRRVAGNVFLHRP